MKTLLIGGNHPRHLFYADSIDKEFDLDGLIIFRREEIKPHVPNLLNEIDRINFIRHFENRQKAEEKYFQVKKIPNCKTIEVDEKTLNSRESVNFVNSIKPDIVLIFGTGLIKEPLFSALPKNTINLHLGISPRYRGAATLFWPFYFMEPNYAGSTFHHIISEPDAGEIIHQSIPKLEHSDKIHDVACKTVIQSTVDAIELLNIFKSKRKLIGNKQKSSGKNFLVSDFKPEHLRVIYNIFDDDMVKQYLNGELKAKTPQLIRQF